MCCELLNPISFNLKWEEEPPKEEADVLQRRIWP